MGPCNTQRILVFYFYKKHKNNKPFYNSSRNFLYMLKLVFT